MKKLAFAVAVVGAAGLVAACGGGDDDDVDIVDSGAPDAALEQCNPVTQTGCADGEKCAQLVLSAGPPALAQTDCVPNGNVALGAVCEPGEPGEESGYDNCAAAAAQGGQCVNGLCREICQSPADTCGEGFSCTFFSDLYEDVDVDGGGRIGVCLEVCDPIAQDCTTEGDGCYLDPLDLEGDATCVGVVPPAAGLTQGMPCYGLDDDSCYLNGCEAGFHPTVIDIPPDGGKSTCTAYCEPVDTYIADPDGDGTGDPIGDAVGLDDEDPKTAPVDCSAERIGAIDHQCRYFQQVGDGQGGVLDYIPARYGWCLDSGNPTSPNTAFYGDCAATTYERQFKAYDEGYPDAMTTGDEARDLFCEEFPEQCGAFCTSNATFDAIANTYCATFTDSPICEPLRSGRLGDRDSALRRIYEGRARAAPAGP